LAIHPLLEIRHLSVSYQNSAGTVRAVRDVSMQIFAGETVALAGETGSGKSTLALALLGLFDRQLRLDTGEIFFEGRNLRLIRDHEWKRIRSRKIGAVFQDMRSALNPVISIGDHLTETIRAHQALSKREARARALELLKEVGIPEDRYHMYPFEISGGECQRVGIALGICNHPRLLIADEPTSSVDLVLQTQIINLLQTMKQQHGLTLLMISHDLPLISSISDRAAIMYHGAIVEIGPSSTVLKTPAHPYTAGLIESQPDMFHHHEIKPLAAVAGCAPRSGEDVPGCAFAPRCTDRLPQCSSSIPVLREISDHHWVACFNHHA